MVGQEWPSMWSVCVWYVVGMWSVCVWYVVGMWLVCGWYIVGMWLVCGRYVVGMWFVCGWNVVDIIRSTPSLLILHVPVTYRNLVFSIIRAHTSWLQAMFPSIPTLISCNWSANQQIDYYYQYIPPSLVADIVQKPQLLHYNDHSNYIPSIAEELTRG